MENASKALLIAGGILIAMLIISIGVYLFMTNGELGSSYEKTLEANELVKLNNNFTKFEGRTDINAQEIITTINFVKEYKEQTEYEILITIEGKKVNTINPIDFISENSEQIFKCGIINYDDYGKVKSINFAKV